MIEFFMPMAKVPTATHQEIGIRVVNGKAITFEKPAAKQTREKLMAHLGPFKPTEMFVGRPLRLTAKWCYKATGKHKDGEYKITRPDTDNLDKTLKDCMTDLGFWKDDSLVASEIIEKFWADLPGIYVKIEEL